MCPHIKVMYFNMKNPIWSPYNKTLNVIIIIIIVINLRLESQFEVADYHYQIIWFTSKIRMRRMWCGTRALVLESFDITELRGQWPGVRNSVNSDIYFRIQFSAVLWPITGSLSGWDAALYLVRQNWTVATLTPLRKAQQKPNHEPLANILIIIICLFFL